ncbi:CusA/CzcA family heavy metal efflux RND transporter [Geobacter sulfurreducens]|jgi:Cu(I)/Ag(I) efflux system membrane protein CusA/SilA|uniref:Metal ion efflux pump, RND family, inner membrane protein n=1 Tax=Geobacter sulfurreducens (strain ATCC 51573 / DSM 12127 / PCA) TaxID=243231 RepID=Q74DI4_GEOSL|nr:CusA/CzcA family heavy metal efflux RND transporter [Geobacter sulfurreducens]MCF0398162.1 CusA/CzcA family heavy metal efflux RND transporter [Klebsiella pneumoniae]AAR34708.1 metal ion efflux pump, RND family, inner membrane protein [Geobacter sulfurreducens PCA]ADI84166.1 metal ion efflux pump, RND family, inner membrane protein [Geobacter sulfurreducens KN400]AJY71038.1 cation transporter [Geobacter sulfurreducens]MCF0403391.1 CusA/CzcA family heavy metal efflux RND transporter [Klebsie
MIEKIIEYSARNRVIILMLFALVIGWGIWAVYKTPVDAIPDLSDNQVIVFTDFPGRSPQVVEDQVTYPLAVNLQGLPRVKAVRASSAFGFSMIYVIFDDKADIYWARTRVLERLNYAASLLPAGVVPTLGPDGTGVGHVFWYTLEGKGYDLEQLRTLQDWFVRYQLNTVPGVAEVASIGGFVREYQVDLDPHKLFAYNIKVSDVMEAIKAANNDVGGRLLEQADAEYLIRGRGYVKSPADIENIVVTADMRGTPVYVKNLGTVQMGGAIRRGLLDLNGEGEVVGGIVVMRYGENAKDVIDRVKEKITALEKGLPPGVKIKTAYDRSDLIERAIHTLKRALTEESIVVSLVVLVFLLHFQSALVIVLTLPIAVLIAFITMKLMGVSSNIMSLGGIAIAIGVLVDAGVIMVENCYRHLSELPEEERKARRLEVIIASAKQVGRAIFFSLAIIVLSFVPVFLLEGQEGKLFHPLAFTKTFSMVGSALIAITLVPVLMYFFMRGKMPLESANPVSRFFIRLYGPVIRWCLKWKKTVIALNMVALLVAVPLYMKLGSEFMPPLDEGSLLYMPVTLPNVSITEAKRIIQVQDAVIKSHPEVELVLGKVGRAETSTDPAPVSMFESIIILKPKDTWRPGITKNDIVSELDARLQQIGVRNGWTQPIINRINMLSTGVRTDLGLKIFGNDLNVLRDLAVQAEGILKGVNGAADVVAERVTGGNYLDIDIDREAAARYGVKVADVQEVIATALGGETLTTAVDGRNRFPIRLRYLRDYRDSIPAIQRILVSGMGGAQVPLSQVTKLKVSTGAPEIASEGGLLRSIVFLNVRGRDMGSFMKDAQAVVEKQLKLPPGYYVSWSGQWENQVRAKARLQVLIPAGIVIIFILLYFTFHSALEASMVMLSVPFALVGGVYLVAALGYNMSVAVWVGFIALYGVAVETGVVMVIYLHEALDKKLMAGPVTEQDIYDATYEGAVLRLRPKLMTVAVALMGLVPIMWSSGTGADVMKPIAAPMIGGMISSAIHVLIMTPVIFVLMKKHDLKKGKLKYSGMKH